MIQITLDKENSIWMVNVPGTTYLSMYYCLLQGELSTVRKQYETQKVHLTGKSRKTTMELKQQT